MTDSPLRSQSINELYVKIIETGCKTVCFTSAGFQEGITTIASALAATAAAYGRKVLYCDFGNYNTSLSKQLHIVVAAPKDNLLKLNPRTIQAADSLNFDLFSLPGPRPLDTSLVTKSTLLNFFDPLKEKYDLIVIDAHSYNKYQPHAMPVHLLCEVADATVMVILSGKVSLIEVKQATTEMTESGAKLLGFVMNDRDYPPLVDELCKATSRLDKYFPKLAAILRQRFRDSVMLNTEL